MKAAVEQALADRAAQQAGAPDEPVSTGEQSILLREMNHRIGNNLQLIASLLHMQGGASSNIETRQALAGASNRVAAVAQVHRRLYLSDDVRQVALAPYLESLADDLRRAAQQAAEDLTVTADPIEIDPDRALAIGVIVTELVINARKYAYPNGEGPIRVTLQRRDGGVHLVVEDDGVGQAATKDGASTGLGRRIIDAMAAKLGARIAYDAGHTGTRASLIFNLT
jgi:two-component sensor histidine kinase